MSEMILVVSIVIFSVLLKSFPMAFLVCQQN